MTMIAKSDDEIAAELYSEYLKMESTRKKGPSPSKQTELSKGEIDYLSEFNPDMSLKAEDPDYVEADELYQEYLRLQSEHPLVQKKRREMRAKEKRLEDSIGPFLSDAYYTAEDALYSAGDVFTLGLGPMIYATSNTDELFKNLYRTRRSSQDEEEYRENIKEIFEQEADRIQKDWKTKVAEEDIAMDLRRERSPWATFGGGIVGGAGAGATLQKGVKKLLPGLAGKTSKYIESALDSPVLRKLKRIPGAERLIEGGGKAAIGGSLWYPGEVLTESITESVLENKPITFNQVLSNLNWKIGMNSVLGMALHTRDPRRLPIRKVKDHGAIKRGLDKFDDLIFVSSEKVRDQLSKVIKSRFVVRLSEFFGVRPEYRLLTNYQRVKDLVKQKAGAPLNKVEYEFITSYMDHLETQKGHLLDEFNNAVLDALDAYISGTPRGRMSVEQFRASRNVLQEYYTKIFNLDNIQKKAQMEGRAWLNHNKQATNARQWWEENFVKYMEDTIKNLKAPQADIQKYVAELQAGLKKSQPNSGMIEMLNIALENMSGGNLDAGEILKMREQIWALGDKAIKDLYYAEGAYLKDKEAAIRFKNILQGGVDKRTGKEFEGLYHNMNRIVRKKYPGIDFFFLDDELRKIHEIKKYVGDYVGKTASDIKNMPFSAGRLKEFEELVRYAEKLNVVPKTQFKQLGVDVDKLRQLGIDLETLSAAKGQSQKAYKTRGLISALVGGFIGSNLGSLGAFGGATTAMALFTHPLALRAAIKSGMVPIDLIRRLGVGHLMPPSGKLDGKALDLFVGQIYRKSLEEFPLTKQGKQIIKNYLDYSIQEQENK